MDWYKADETVPHDDSMVEIASFSPGNEPPFWHLSHAWYNKASESWVRRRGENWPIEYWRYSANSLNMLLEVSDEG